MQSKTRGVLRIFSTFICILLLHESSLSQPANVDVCAYFTGKKGMFAEYGSGSEQLICSTAIPMAPGTAEYFIVTGPTVGLLVELLRQGAAQAKSIAGLREELVKATDALTAALVALDEASKEIAKKNAKWRDEALRKNLDAIAGVPVSLAENEGLRRALASAIANDTTFLDEVKKALK